MKISHKETENGVVIYLADELGHHEAAEVISYIENIIALYIMTDIILDFSNFSSLDSFVIAVVMNIVRQLHRNVTSFNSINP